MKHIKLKPNIDWQLLQEQKHWLMEYEVDHPEAEDLLHLLDHIQDMAVEQGVATVSEVFGYTLYRMGEVINEH